METAACLPTKRARQLHLFTLDNPLSAWFGAAFFRTIPPHPGVYFFRDSEDSLLYIGQSCNLRARLGSYRHVSPERHPRRLLRLVHCITSIQWHECPTAEDAVELERQLLLEHRPPFNRTGVWPGTPWWLTACAKAECLRICLTRQPTDPSASVGPLSPGFRYVHATLMRCLYRVLNPDRDMASYPIGLLNRTAPLGLSFKAQEASSAARDLIEFALARVMDFFCGWSRKRPKRPLKRRSFG